MFNFCQYTNLYFFSTILLILHAEMTCLQKKSFIGYWTATNPQIIWIRKYFRDLINGQQKRDMSSLDQIFCISVFYVWYDLLGITYVFEVGTYFSFNFDDIGVKYVRPFTHLLKPHSVVGYIATTTTSKHRRIEINFSSVFTMFHSVQLKWKSGKLYYYTYYLYYYVCLLRKISSLTKPSNSI